MNKVIPWVLLVIGIVAGFLFFRKGMSSEEPATVWEQNTEVKVDAVSLFEAFIQDETGANEKYLNKIVEVSGQVATSKTGNQGSNYVVLKTNDPTSGIRCRLDSKPGQSPKNYKVGQKVTFKCLCSGYVQDVEMMQCKEK